MSEGGGSSRARDRPGEERSRGFFAAGTEQLIERLVAADRLSDGDVGEAYESVHLREPFTGRGRNGRCATARSYRELLLLLPPPTTNTTLVSCPTIRPGVPAPTKER